MENGSAETTADVQQNEEMIPISEYNKMKEELTGEIKKVANESKERKFEIRRREENEKKQNEERLKEQEKFKELAESREKEITELKDKLSKYDPEAYEKTTEIMTSMIKDLKEKVTDKAVLDLLEEKTAIQQYEWLTNYVKEKQKDSAAVHTARAGGLPVEAPTSFDDILKMSSEEQEKIHEKFPDLWQKLRDSHMKNLLKKR